MLFTSQNLQLAQMVFHTGYIRTVLQLQGLCLTTSKVRGRLTGSQTHGGELMEF